MGVKEKTRILLWGRAASRCSYPGCQIELFVDATQTDDESLIGEACHIIADSPKGPRGESPLGAEEREKYANLILLCRNHHKPVDDQSHTHTPERLREMKSNHERWVREKLEGYDTEKQQDNELYAGYIDEIVSKLDFDNWEGWASSLAYPDGPILSIDREGQLVVLKKWLFSRIWPHRYEPLENAIENVRRVLNDLLYVFHIYAEKERVNYVTRKFYKIPEWNPKLYNKLLTEYEFHKELVDDLLFEATRACNYFSEQVRGNLDSTFRLHEGILLVTLGPYMDMTYRHHKLEYTPEEKIPIPYPGLKEFMEIRETREMCSGKGLPAHSAMHTYFRRDFGDSE